MNQVLLTTPSLSSDSGQCFSDIYGIGPEPELDKGIGIGGKALADTSRAFVNREDQSMRFGAQQPVL